MSKLLLPTVTQLREERAAATPSVTPTSKTTLLKEDKVNVPATKSINRSERPPGERPPGERPPGERPPGERPPGERPFERGRGSERGRGRGSDKGSERGRGRGSDKGFEKDSDRPSGKRGRPFEERGRGGFERGKGFERKVYIPPTKDLSELAIEGDYQRVALANYVKGEERYSHALVYGQHPEVTKELIKNGAKVTVQDNIALITSCKMGALRTVQLLLNAGASLTTHSTMLSSLSHVVENGYDEILHLLLFQPGCQVSEEDRKSLVSLAKKYGQTSCIAILNPNATQEEEIMRKMLLY